MTEQEIDDEIKRLEEEARIDAEIAQLESGSSGIKGPSQESDILDQPADLSGRFAMKSFGTDIPSKLKYYREKNPDKDIMENPYNKGEIIARIKGTSQWLKEDPSNWQGWKELGRDILDVPVDLLQGTITGLTAAGSAAAAPYTPVAAATLGATGAHYTTEAIRQGIGQKFFGQQPVIPTFGDVLTTGALEAAGGKIFGAPGMTKQKFMEIAKERPEVAKKALKEAEKYFIPEGKTPTAEEAQKAGEYLAEKSTGLLGKVKKNILPIWFGGQAEEIERAQRKVPKDVVMSLIKNQGLKIDPNVAINERELSQAIQAQGLGGAGKSAITDITNSVKNLKESLGARYEEGISSISDPFDLSRYKRMIQPRINELSASKTEGVSEQAKDLKNVMSKYLTPKKQPKQVTETVMQNVGGLVDEFGNPVMMPTKVSVEKMVEGTNEIGAKELQAISNALKSEYNIGAPKYVVMQMPAAKQQNRGVILNITGEIDNQLEKAIGDKTLRKDYRDFSVLQKKIYPLFKDEKTAAKTLSNAYNSNATQKQTLKDLRYFDKKFGTNLESMSSVAFTGKRFGDPSLEQISQEGRLASSRVLRPAKAGGAIGTALGSLVGGQFGGYEGALLGGALGGTAGAGIGAFTANDAALNFLLNQAQRFEKIPLKQTYEKTMLNPYLRGLMMQPGYQWINQPNSAIDQQEENK